MKRLAAPAIMAAIVGIASCSTDECFDNKNSLPLAGFYSSAETPQPISIDSISIYGIDVPGDSVLHDSVRSLKESYLPFRIDRGETKYVIKYLSGLLGRFGIADTITFRYEIQPWFVSTACGVVYYYDMDTIVTTHHVIDSVTCPGGKITNVSSENLRIYFRVSTEE